MPNLNHCIECDKPTANSITKLCDNCKEKVKEKERSNEKGSKS